MPTPTQPATLDAATLVDIDQLIDLAVAEDVGQGVDCTSRALFDRATQGKAQFLPRKPGVLCGLSIARRLIARIAPALQFQEWAGDGECLEAGRPFAQLEGDAREILLVERTCLNFLGRLSGIATLTATYVQQLAGTRARLFDTRKTTPGWRRLEKYAVRCGGGYNHRLGLHDAILIKDNHLAMLRIQAGPNAKILELAIERARNWIKQEGASLPHGQETILEIEVDRIEQLREALPARPNIILLDNMSPDLLRQAVTLRDQLAPSVELEASGGITLANLREIAQTGVERISVGALTHSAVNFDIGLDWVLA